MRAAGTEAPELEQLDRRLHRYRCGGQAKMITKILGTSTLRPGLSLQEAATTFSMLAGPELHHMLTAEHGWSQKRYVEWLDRTIAAALLP